MSEPAIDYARAHKDWQESNPLRQWRKDNGISIHAAAGMIGCSMSTVQLWEAGAAEPSDEHMERLAKILGPNAPRRWEMWQKRNPTADL